ncbi:hypothetical protein Zm00014a_006001 [Zea mays]|uniref:Uncharacterized protein n=1 Tax=Zea mays TaxID=4577 RepID=A0A317YFK1_MAIZE|nr:hypothetical protein Zm00014a_006001 [Zea mays]
MRLDWAPIQVVPAPVRVGEDEPPPSWVLVPDPFSQDKMFRGSPKIVALSKAAQKKASPKAATTKKCGGAPTVNQEKETKRVRKDALEGLIGRYLDVKTKQVADEAAQSAKVKDVAQDNDFSIKRCISVLKTMDMTRDEKVKAAEVFNIPNYRETFICFNDDEPEVALLWLRGKMDKL